MRPAALVLLLLGVQAVHAQPVRITATVDHTSVTTDDVVRYEVEVVGAPMGSVAQPSLPALDGLTAPNPFPITMGEEATGQAPRVVFRWSFQPTRTGTARIGATTVVVDGRQGRTAPVVVRVRPGLGAPPAPATPGSAPFAGGPPAKGARLERDDVLLRASASTMRTVVGAQVVVEYRLYARPDLDLRFSPAGAWNASGFWREDLSVPSRPVPQPATLDGRRYSSVPVQRVALFPTQAGRLVVPPLTITGEADVPIAAQLYGPAGPRTTTTFRATSAPITLTVDALPAQPGYSGLTGRVTLDATLLTRTVAAGEAARVQVRVAGDANLAALEPPALGLPDSLFDVFAPEAALSAVRTGSRLTATRTFTYSVVPRRAGTYPLPPVEVVVYDPPSARFRTLRSAPGTLTVTPGAEAEPAAAPALQDDPADRLTASAWTPARLLSLGIAALVLVLIALQLRRPRRRRPAPPQARPHPHPTAPPVPPVPPPDPFRAADAALATGDLRAAADALAAVLSARAPGGDARFAALRATLNAARYAPVPPDADELRAARAELGHLLAARPPVPPDTRRRSGV